MRSTTGPRWTARLRLRGSRRRLGVAQALGLVAAATTSAVVLAAVLVTLTDPRVFPNLGVALWWAATTITTVGYGDVVPLSAIGRAVGAVLMFGGVGALAFVTAIAASSIVVGEVEEEEREIEAYERRLARRLDRLETRLARIERLLRAPGPDGRDRVANSGS
ncbi:MAG TPA: potassium channel family protein [Actinophytocola sp.]|jgi:voltage-gated potassium channel|uniref:potassium channel family protein n=1 Tax=Actinophytocola sp. TaxID=1872138 RepID=UPI002F93FD01